MNDFRKILFRKGSVGFLSSTGVYGYWYPDPDNPIRITEDIIADHMFLWKNQDPYFAFRIPAWALDLKVNISDDRTICVWFHEKSIVIEKAMIEKIKK